MKRGALNFLGRKNQSLFDTNVKIKDMDNVELVLDSPAILESGTASVRARPTVKHHASSDSFQGFAVPTPKVPLLPPVNGPKGSNGSVSGARCLNGSVISVPDLVEEEIFVPPPPSVAPPPPPDTLILPPPDFMGDLNGAHLDTLQTPSVPAPKESSLAPSMEEDLAFLKPPPMAPPKPPSTSSSSTISSLPISSPLPAEVPDHPKFAPPQPPVERQKTHKTPPPKPIRLSSIPTLDSPPDTPAPPPPVQMSTVSSFNPQNTAKLYSVPNAPVLSGYEDRETRPKHMLLLEDSGSVNSPSVVVPKGTSTIPQGTRTGGPQVVTPSTPVSKDVQELKENLQPTTHSSLPDPNEEAKTVTVSAKPEIAKPLQTPPPTSTQLQKVNSTQVNLEPIKDNFEGSPSQSRRFSPLLDHKLRNLKSNETNGPREGHAASPLALLKAAKEREKQKSTLGLTQENVSNKFEQQSLSIHPSETNPNSFVVIPKSSSPSSLTSQERIQESLKSVSPVEHTQTVQIPKISPSATKSVEQKQNAEQSPSKSPSEDNKEGLSVPLLPPPPEFDDLNYLIERPPSIRPPDPPKKKTQMPNVNLPPPAPVSAPTVNRPPSAPVSAPAVNRSSPAPVSAPAVKRSSPAPVSAPAVNLPPPASVSAPAVNRSSPAPVSAPAVNLPSPAPVSAPAVNLPPLAPVSAPAVNRSSPAPVSAPTVNQSPPALVPTPALSIPPPPPPPPSQKLKPPAAPKLPPSDINVKSKTQAQAKTQVAPTQLPSTLSPSQATLLSILQKKMLEMDHKMAPVKESEPSSDDWGAPLSDEENKAPVVTKATPQSKNSPVVNNASSLDMRELEGKVVKKYKETSSVKVPTSNGPSKHQYGMTFTVRPGTKQPITLVSKGES